MYSFTDLRNNSFARNDQQEREALFYEDVSIWNASNVYINNFVDSPINVFPEISYVGKRIRESDNDIGRHKKRRLNNQESLDEKVKVATDLYDFTIQRLQENALKGAHLKNIRCVQYKGLKNTTKEQNHITYLSMTFKDFVVTDNLNLN